MTDLPAAEVERRFPCAQCGAKLMFEPGGTDLLCPYCGHRNAIAASGAAVMEESFDGVAAQLESRAETEEHTTVKCQACAAQTDKPANVTALACPFCGADIVMTGMTRRLIKPRSLLPFEIKREKADALFRDWVRGLWFAPTRLRRLAGADQRLSGMYMPFWTYDCRTATRYHGKRGDNYTVTETYAATENGQTVTRTRTVVRTRWSSASGNVHDAFDDLLVMASESLPRSIVDSLEPWDLKKLMPYDDAYLSGFRAESYTIDLKGGFARAQALMEPTIVRSIHADIGGDHQQIDSKRTTYSDVTFKHILLPVWISAYRFHDKTYRFVVNARTGEVRGERPYSAWKITTVAVAAAAIIAAIVMIASR